MAEKNKNIINVCLPWEMSINFMPKLRYKRRQHGLFELFPLTPTHLLPSPGQQNEGFDNCRYTFKFTVYPNVSVGNSICLLLIAKQWNC